jgi:hypothetical protein
MSKPSCGAFLALFVSAVLASPGPLRAEDNGPNTTRVVDCNDAGSKSTCGECCTGPQCGGRIACCPLSGDCTVKGDPVGPGPLSAAAKLKFIIGALNLQFQRTVKADYVEVKLKASFVKKSFPRGINAKVRLTGPDALIAGFVWPVAFLGQGDSAATALANAGINATITGAPATCQSLFPAQACTDMAVGLSRNIQGGLGVAGKDDLNRFVDAVNNMGLGPCGIIF